DFVVAYGGNVEIEIAAGDRLRPACEQLDRAGDSARKKHSEPAPERYHHQSDQYQRQQVAVQDGLAKNSQLEVVLGNARYVGRARRQALRQIVVDQEQLAIGGEHLDGAEVVFLLALGDERFEVVALFRREQALSRNLLGQHAGEMRRVVGRVQI